MNGRTALGACLVLLAVLAGAIFLDRAQRLVPVYAAARDLAAGVPLKSGDLMVIRVRLPASALRHYLRPSAGRAVAGSVLAAPIRRETLVPTELVFASSRHADLVELPVQAEQGDMAQGLRPGDNVQGLAAFTEGARRGRAVVLLPSAEVVRVLEDAAGLAGSGQERGVQLRMPSERAPAVVAAIATARIFVVKAPGPAAAPTSPVPDPALGPDPALDPGPGSTPDPTLGPDQTLTPDSAPGPDSATPPASDPAPPPDPGSAPTTSSALDSTPDLASAREPTPAGWAGTGVAT